MAETEEFVQSLTTKEIKALARPEFAANPDKFYPTKTLKSLGYSRAQCPECNNYFWRHTDKKITCGDSLCEKKYSFIGRGTGIGRRKKEGGKGKKITFGEAWLGFKESLTTARVPCTAIDRYPVVARWRADVDYVAAGIFCFQPFCVTGELEPPANPLIQPQFCLRFNDLDNIGLTGRHYSGFIMLGIQVFNKPGDKKFWADECIEFNFRWLTETLEIDPDEITFIEDVWAGGGNLGPSIEYFVNGLEVGNMVFMQYKTFPDGSREPLQVQVIDVGIGLERIPWLINGTATSYMDTFKASITYFLDKVEIKLDTEIWDKYGPLSCMLNVDEVEDINKTWQWIADKIGLNVDDVKTAIEPIRDAYIIMDHTRCILMAIEDGSLPSNVGGASNVRNILRRCFSIMHTKGWWEKFGMDGFIEIFAKHKIDLKDIYGEFKEYKSFRPIIELEYERWQCTDGAMKDKLTKLLKKKKGVLSVDDWVVCVTSWGLPADLIAEITKISIPGNLWYEIAERQERTVKAQATVLYNTAHLPATDSLYYADHHMYDFSAKIIEIFPNVADKMLPNIVVLDQSAFYPTSGGQDHDNGTMTIDGTTYQVIDAMKVGPCVLHVLDSPVPGALDDYKGKAVTATIDVERRSQLRNHHTATHIVYASCRKTLGPHVWQQGAKKTTKQAHLDITHFNSLSHEDVMQIQTEANRVVQRCKQITKGFMKKDKAEKKYGFHLYQGGVVPGNELRVVDIAGTDTEACCGTHADNTAEVGMIKILKTSRISDGIVRLYFVAGERALSCINEEANILNGLTTSWGIMQSEIPTTADRFFDGYKQLKGRCSKQDSKILELNMKVHLLDSEAKCAYFTSDQENATLYVSNMPTFAQKIKDSGKGVVYVGKTFLYGLIASNELFDPADLQAVINCMTAEAEKQAKEGEVVKKPKLIVKNNVVMKGEKKKGKAAKVKVEVIEFTCFSLPNKLMCAPPKICEFLESKAFKLNV